MKTILALIGRESFLDPRVVTPPGVNHHDVIDIRWITAGRKEAAEKMLQASEKSIIARDEALPIANSSTGSKK